MNPHYYLMKGKKILRLEEGTSFSSLSAEVRSSLLDAELVSMNQEKANWRVVLFRDEILELEEYLSWLTSPEACLDEEEEFDLAAN
jgi:hypothetical protein